MKPLSEMKKQVQLKPWAEGNCSHRPCCRSGRGVVISGIHVLTASTCTCTGARCTDGTIASDWFSKRETPSNNYKNLPPLLDKLPIKSLRNTIKGTCEVSDLPLENVTLHINTSHVILRCVHHCNWAHLHTWTAVKNCACWSQENEESRPALGVRPPVRRRCAHGRHRR